jgi:hypothetical protein
MRFTNSTTFRIALFAFFAIPVASAGEKTPPTYQKGTITGWDMKYYPGGFSSKHKFYALKGVGTTYQIDSGGAFRKCGPFQPEQSVDYRVDDKFVYIRVENSKEDKCGITGAKTDAPSTAP